MWTNCKHLGIFRRRNSCQLPVDQNDRRWSRRHTEHNLELKVLLPHPQTIESKKEIVHSSGHRTVKNTSLWLNLAKTMREAVRTGR